MVQIGPGIWLLGSLWLVAMIVFMLSIRSNNHFIGIGFGLAITLVTIVLAVIPERINDDSDDSSEDVDENFAIKIVYCVVAPLIAIGSWGYHGVNELYRPIRIKRVQTAW